MIEIKSKKKNYGIRIPSSIGEITPEVLNTLVKGVKLPKHYCIVALCFDTKLFDFMTSINAKKPSTVAVSPLLAAISDEDSELINANIGDKLILNRTAIELGTQVNIKTMAAYNNIAEYINSDPELIKAIYDKDENVIKVGNNLNKGLMIAKSPRIIVLEFKIIAVNDIRGAVDVNHIVTDPFINKSELN